MIDIHCHILHGLDDGPATLEESVEMCRIAHEDGIRTIVATPHFRPGTYQWSSGMVNSKRDELADAIAREDISLSLLQGADVTVTPELPEQLERQRDITINGNGRYFLAEFPHDTVPPNWELFLFGMMQQGVIPVITHPERTGWFLSRPEALSSFVSAGGLVQITAGSLIGEMGEGPKKCAFHLLRNGLAHVIATDGHSSTVRKPVLSRAVVAASSVIGEQRTLRMVTDIPRMIIEGKRFDLPGPVVPSTRKRSWFQKVLDF